ncbi:MAG: hypothetical protein IJ745_03510 [Bacteroidales bacterium]|nr:hypothetical protein [Bacteroidales bacterium]
MALTFSVRAQWCPAAEVDTWSDRPEAGTWSVGADSGASAWDFHFSAGTTVATVGGHGDAYLWAMPRVAFRASDRLTLRGGFAAVGSLLDSYELQGGSRSLMPVRRGTQMVSLAVAAEYRVNDRLTLWASLSHTDGWHEPLWSPWRASLPVGVTTFSGGCAYELSETSMLEMHFHIVHDHYGNDALGILGHPYYGWRYPAMELYREPWRF